MRERRIVTAGLAVGATLLFLGGLLGGPVGRIAIAGLEVAPILVIGWLARSDQPWARGLCWGLAYLLVVLAGVGIMALAGIAYPGAPARRIAVMVAVVAAFGVIAILSAGPLNRQLLAWLHLDADHHRLALFLCIGLTAVCLAPLIGTGGRALLLDLIAEAPQDWAVDPDTATDSLLPLVWIIPGAFLLAGYGVQRDFPATLDRLGLGWPGWRGIGQGVGAGLALVPAALVLGGLLSGVMGGLDLPTTDNKELESLFGLSKLSVAGALALAVAAGVGEELAVRGLLQPRLGLVLANLLFAALHALQYTADGVLLVFGLGVAFGVLRRRTNTVVSMVAHAVYNFALIGVLLAAAAAQGAG